MHACRDAQAVMPACRARECNFACPCIPLNCAHVRQVHAGLRRRDGNPLLGRARSSQISFEGPHGSGTTVGARWAPADPRHSDFAATDFRAQRRLAADAHPHACVRFARVCLLALQRAGIMHAQKASC
eukprot:15159949-Alexandrium_andersonii.AAC.1